MQKNLVVHIDEEVPQFTRNIPNSQDAHLMTKEEHPRIVEVTEKISNLEKRMRVVEGFSVFKLNVMCLVLDLVIPHKFKVLDFEKYIGDKFPRYHLVMSCRKWPLMLTMIS